MHRAYRRWRDYAVERKRFRGVAARVLTRMRHLRERKIFDGAVFMQSALRRMIARKKCASESRTRSLPIRARVCRCLPSPRGSESCQFASR